MDSVERLQICLSCPSMEYNFGQLPIIKTVIGRTCGEFNKETDDTCGCLLDIKTKVPELAFKILPSLDCPQGKWKPENIKTPMRTLRYRLEDGSLIKTDMPHATLVEHIKKATKPTGMFLLDDLYYNVKKEGKYYIRITERSDLKPIPDESS